MKAAANCQVATWRKPIGSCISFTTGDLPPERWQSQTFSFVPKADGEITLKLMGRGERSVVDDRFIPVWTCYDDVRVEGAELVNGSFERIDAAGTPVGWKQDINRSLVVTDTKTAAEGNRCVKCWHNGRWKQTLAVKAGRKITVRCLVRGEATAR